MKSIHVLTFDGGGMRGLYSVSVLETLAQRFAQKRGCEGLDIGKGFDLILGTSTGAILASGLAFGVEISKIRALYCTRGREIFTDPMPKYARNLKLSHRLRFYRWCYRHRSRPSSDGQALNSALQDIFGNSTLGEVYKQRSIGLCITATALHQHHPRIFKTGHLGVNFRRDDGLRLVDICLASAAAPVYLPLAASNGNSEGERNLYADGGLWANNPVVLGLTEALAISEENQPIRILSIGTCARQSGDPTSHLQRGLLDWKAGAAALELSMNAQARAAHFQAEHLVKHLNRHGMDVMLFRCVETAPSIEMDENIGLDQASERATEALICHGAEDGTNAFRECQAISEGGQLIEEVFGRMPQISQTTNQQR